MRALITGGSGFLGATLARTLLAAPSFVVDGQAQQLSRLTLVDRAEPPGDLLGDERTVVVQGDLYEALDGGELTRPGSPLLDADVVIHLAAAVSGESEQDFDLGMRTNLLTTQKLLHAVRSSGRRPVVVFASSLAVYGQWEGLPLPDVVTDTTLPLPRSSYGTQKLLCEYLVHEYDRKGFIRGRTARLMTVTVRPGRPNQAASSFLSGIIREPLAGHRARCPVASDMVVAVSSPAATIAGLIRVAGLTDAEWGDRLAVTMPALTLRVADMVAALERVAGPAVVDRIDWVPDPSVEAIVGSWPTRFDSSAAQALGVPGVEDFDSVIRAYVRDVGASGTSGA